MSKRRQFMQWPLVALFTFSSFAATLPAAELPVILQEPNLERRSQLAIEYANTALDMARTAYLASEIEKAQTALNEVGEAVDLAYDSLQKTGKEARRNPKFFKRTELATRQILRRMQSMVESMSFQDRALAEKVRDRVAAIHDDLLQAIMAKKKP